MEVSILGDNRAETVLLVSGSDAASADILDRLFESDFNVVGPAPNAALALALAAQSPLTLALVATRPTGKRNAAELADELMRTWGVPSMILAAADGEGGGEGASSWRAPSERIAHIRDVLASRGGDAQSA